MKLDLRGRVPFVTVQVTYEGASLEVDNVIVDTGSAGTVLAADVLAELGIAPGRDDRIRTLRGIGGSELVFARRVERLSVGEMGVDAFEVEVGEMDYGFAIQGILGMDFLMGVGAVLDLRALTIESNVQ